MPSHPAVTILSLLFYALGGVLLTAAIYWPASAPDVVARVMQYTALGWLMLIGGAVIQVVLPLAFPRSVRRRVRR